MSSGWYSDRRAVRYNANGGTLTMASGGSATAGFFMGDAAGVALFVPSGFSGTVEFQAMNAAETWASIFDSSATRITVTDAVAGAWVTLSADLFPFDTIRLLRSNGAGEAANAGSDYGFELVKKS